MTSDQSSGGVYVFVRQFIPVNSPAEFDIAFPVELTDEIPRKFLCQGRVTRCENIRGLYGIGMAIDTRQLIEDRTLQRRSRITPSGLFADIPEDGEAGVRVRDITRAGAFLEIPRLLPIGREVLLVLRERDLPAPIQVTAAVRRAEPAVGIGVEFVEVSKEADRLLRAMPGQVA